MERVAHPVLSAMPTTRRLLLDALKRRGRLPIEALAATAEITVSGARQHLTALERDGLVRHEIVREGPGRPKYLFALTAAADTLYPRTYAELTNELLEYVAADDPSLLERIFEQRRRRRLERARARLEGKPLGEQVAELARILDEDGYLAECETRPDGTYRLVEHNCAVLDVARRYGQACSSELEFIRQSLPAATVDRVAHLLAGAFVCAYQVTPRSDPPAQPGESE
jgi:DeoR family suf operon transcriptional repressor